MKMDKAKFLRSIGSMMLLAEILHSVMQLRGSVRPRGDTHRDDCSAGMEKAFKRLCTAVDYTAQKADNLLKKKIASAPSVKQETVVFTLLPADDKNGKQY